MTKSESRDVSLAIKYTAAGLGPDYLARALSALYREGHWQSMQALIAAKKTGVLYSDWHPVFGIL
jgi:hypothetical protein